jgi:hypothetical protein
LIIFASERENKIIRRIQNEKNKNGRKNLVLSWGSKRRPARSKRSHVPPQWLEQIVEILEDLEGRQKPLAKAGWCSQQQRSLHMITCIQTVRNRKRHGNQKQQATFVRKEVHSNFALRKGVNSERHRCYMLD